MRIKDFAFYLLHTPGEYRLGVQCYPFWVNGFGCRQIRVEMDLGSFSLHLLYYPDFWRTKNTNRGRGTK